MKVGKEKIIYLMDGIDIQMPIRQYMNLEYLYQLLGTKRYFLRRKQHFEDMAEKMPPMKSVFSLFTPHIVGAAIKDEKQYQKKKKELHELISQLEYAKNLPTSCWTKRNNENYLMWKAYAPDNGVCIKSTIYNFTTSFIEDDYQIVCGEISYNNYKGLRTIDDYLFSKHSFYSNEEEIRFYFDKQDNEEQELTDEHVYIKVDPSVLIDEIILSPFMDDKNVNKAITIVHNNYNCRINKSLVSIKRKQL